MKSILFFIVTVCTFSVQAQTLKDALFSGRLKTDSGTTVKQGDSLKLLSDSLFKLKMDSLKKAGIKKEAQKNNLSDTASIHSTDAAAAGNNQSWNQFIEEYTAIIKKEVLPSSRIKAGTYSVLIEYTIETDGNITTNNVYCTPDNAFLVQQIRARMMMNAPKLSPVLMSNGKPRKVLKKQSLTFVKE
jgi:hypothetical protein